MRRMVLRSGRAIPRAPLRYAPGRSAAEPGDSSDVPECSQMHPSNGQNEPNLEKTSAAHGRADGCENASRKGPIECAMSVGAHVKCAKRTQFRRIVRSHRTPEELRVAIRRDVLRDE